MKSENPKRVQINGEWFDMNTPCDVQRSAALAPPQQAGFESENEYLDCLRDEAIQIIIEIPPGSVDFSGCTSTEQAVKTVIDQIEITVRRRDKH
jgi:hypothetical protein